MYIIFFRVINRLIEIKKKDIFARAVALLKDLLKIKKNRENSIEYWLRG